ncbi:hypothetical protein GGI25_004746 [Coemansia spiralis]|uniref:Serine aminopeptidase S33 domain-containing protein n=2 Tax=Coemansia TaxID=4863 RepID=A0A9W8G4K1_9FUNG|nr:Alpha/Beta hydrolase protein [Coemansia spiralis]KAJ1989720.1 hypothetical protein EDC05_004518 [Coemansia umbellata]KAJ2620527.1 hypothetical protein GGI26_004934 [Coemansia sp. RSA 1358]KAJ2673411.1 hypothetical protein GGI25_004746 [Coemansia spiralis]
MVAINYSFTEIIDERKEWMYHDGIEFYTHLYISVQQPPKATVLIVHDICEHVNRYDALAKAFARSDIQVLGFDQRGFGHTGKRNGHMGDNGGVAAVTRDIAFMSRQVSIPGIPHFLFGHSGGGTYVLNYCSNHNSDGHVSGVIASAPALTMGKMLFPSGISAAGWAKRLMAKISPHSRTYNKLTPEMLTDNKQELEKLATSKYMMNWCTASTLVSMVDMGKAVRRHARSFRTPVLVIIGDSDVATPCEGVREFIFHMPSDSDREYVELINCKYHEIDFQDNLDIDPIEKYVDWIISRTPAPTI